MIISKEQVEILIKNAKKQALSLTPVMAVLTIVFAAANIILYYVVQIDMFSIIFGALSVFFLIIILGTISVKQSKEIANAGHFEKTINQYFTEVQNITIPDSKYEFDNLSSFRTPQFMWFTKDSICFFPKPPTIINHFLYETITEFHIPIKSIKYYYTSGDKYYENKISGGGSTGPNVAGAIIGEQIAGVGGAIVMGQSGVNPVTSELIVHDERRTVILFQNSENQYIKCLIPFDFYEIMYQQLPHLCREVIEGSEKGKMIQQNIGTSGVESLESKLKKLQELKNSGLINDEDYQNQKEKLLSQL